MMIELKQQRELNVSDEIEQPDTHIIVANKYIIEKKIGKGSFGEVFKGFDKDTNEPVAIKVELSKTFQTRSLLEGKILKKLQSFEGIPKLFYCGTEGDYNVLVIELLGPNLEDILNYCDKQLSLKTVLMIADQLIQRIESIHNRGFLHRDIKSDNFLIGTGANMNRIYAIDFGLSKRFVHPHTHEHILMKMHKGLIGTARYASINAHLGLEQGRRDDLQAIGYLIIYLAKASLPWQKIKAKTKEQKYKKILELKDQYTPEQLAEGLPEEFSTFLSYVKRLEFEEKPDYHYMRTLFISLLLKSGNKYDFIFDWMIPKNERQNYQRKLKKKFKTHKLKNIQDSPQQNAIQFKNQKILNDSQIDETLLLQGDYNINVLNKPETQSLLKGETLTSPALIAKENKKSNSPKRIFKKKTFNSAKKQKEAGSPISLQVISEKDEIISPLSKFSQLKAKSPQQRRIPQIRSDIQINLKSVRSSQSPVKNRVNLKVPCQKVSLLKVKKFKSAANCKDGIRKASFNNKSIHLKSIKSGEYSGMDELVDIDEYNQNDRIQIYEFNNNFSKLEQEKTASPIKCQQSQNLSFKSLAALNFEDFIQETKQINQSSKNIVPKTYNYLQAIRKHGKSFDINSNQNNAIIENDNHSEDVKLLNSNQSEVEDEIFDEKSSSMFTEKEEIIHHDISSEDDFHGEEKNQQRRIHQHRINNDTKQQVKQRVIQSVVVKSRKNTEDYHFQDIINKQPAFLQNAKKRQTYDIDQSQQNNKLTIKINTNKSPQSSSSSNNSESNSNQNSYLKNKNESKIQSTNIINTLQNHIQSQHEENKCIIF